ncbi:MAG TPA: PAS domain S-box protein, partial [Candidatus Methanomethylicus sp.]|nr:PAS domain S-box protein [Candidatus Methanomethylicus sp.]
MDLMDAVIQHPERFEYFDLLKFMVIVIDRRGLIIYANKKASEVLGTKRSELIGTNCLDRFIYAAGGEELRMRLDRFMSGPISMLQYEGSFRSAGGDERIISWDCHRLRDGVGNITGAICSGLDITEMRRTECELLMSSDSYRMLFEASPIALIEEDYSQVRAWLDAKQSEGVSDFNAYFSSNPHEVVDLLRLVKTNFMNTAALKLLGVKDKVEFTKNYNAFFSEDSYARFKEQLLRILEKRTVFEDDGINYALDGRQIFTRLKWSIVPGHENSLSRVLISIVDLTDRKRLEDELRRHTVQLEVLVEERTKRLMEAERLAAIGETATISSLSCNCNGQ